MARIFIFLLLLTLLALAAAALLAALRLSAPDRPAKEDPMPSALKTTAYVLLVLLMFGVATGWLGGV